MHFFTLLIFPVNLLLLHVQAKRLAILGGGDWSEEYVPLILDPRAGLKHNNGNGMIRKTIAYI